ncbi:MFS transporter [Pleomorphovibrio marinus]|uniref:MFS transporter n=1 Tax=Pleomorphovibrio marinus TaxID=2164132 RepID=UPI001E5ABEFC|nr:MFS transporter [Pleomorphovibrio marinus]
MNCLSGYGQTYLLALYIPYIIADYSLSNAQVSVYYMLATIGSAFLLPSVGKLIDRTALKPYTLWATLVFVISMVLMSVNTLWFILPFAFFGLRIAGQGLFSHIGITAMSRYFEKGRGKAISLASLGHPLGQALLPISLVGIIEWVGWRESLLVTGALVAVMVPLYLYFFIDEGKLVIYESSPSTGGRKAAENSQWDIIKSPQFLLLAPNLFIFSFVVTALFFYQFAIADFKDWSLQRMALGLTFYAVAGSLAIIVAGPLIDRYSARRFFPFYLIPFFLGVMAVWLVDAKWAIFPYMILMGASSGAGNAIMSAIQVELFGTKNIGKVRSVFASLMVLSSAIGPAVFGVLVDASISYDVIFLASLGLLLLVIAQSFRVIPTYTYARMKYKFKQRDRRFDFWHILSFGSLMGKK